MCVSSQLLTCLAGSVCCSVESPVFVFTSLGRSHEDTLLGSSMHEETRMSHRSTPIHVGRRSADQRSHEECCTCQSIHVIATLFRFELPNTKSGSHQVSTPFIHPDIVIRFVLVALPKIFPNAPS